MKGITLRVPLLAGAVAAALTATTWANMDMSTSSEERSKVAEPVAVGNSQWIPASESLAPDETLVAAEHETVVSEAQSPAPVREAAPAASTPMVAVKEPLAVPRTESDLRHEGIRVEERRLTTDERIQAQVMDAIASTANISGKIGVESMDSVVRLSGYTLTSGQSLRAERAAGRIQGVKYVVNEIRPRMGAITS